MKFMPLESKVLVKLEPETTYQKKGGLIIPPNVKTDGIRKGQVVVTGPGRYLPSGTFIPVGIKKDEHVILGEYSGTAIELEGEKHIIIEENEILAVLR